MPERTHFRWRVLCLPVGFWAQPGGSFWGEKLGQGSDFRPGRLAPGAVCKTVGTAHDGAGSEIEGGGRKQITRVAGVYGAVGDTGLLYKSRNKKIAPRWRGPAKILDIDETGATVKFRSLTFGMARYCIWGKVEAEIVEAAELDPLRARMRTAASALREQSAQRDMRDVTDVDEGERIWTSSTDTPRSEARYHPAATLVPDSPTLSVQLPSSSRSPVRRPESEPSFDGKYESSHVRVVGRAQRDQMSCGQLREQCSKDV